jgi:hypothetical protein
MTNNAQMSYATDQQTATDHTNWVTVRDYDGLTVAAKFIPFDPEVYTGLVPEGYNLVEVQSGKFEDAIYLDSFSEVVPRFSVSFGFLRLPN